jgi:hypothetical protein
MAGDIPVATATAANNGSASSSSVSMKGKTDTATVQVSVWCAVCVVQCVCSAAYCVYILCLLGSVYNAICVC